jgi:hypothetical protein
MVNKVIAKKFSNLDKKRWSYRNRRLLGFQTDKTRKEHPHIILSLQH